MQSMVHSDLFKESARGLPHQQSFGVACLATSEYSSAGTACIAAVPSATPTAAHAFLRLLPAVAQEVPTPTDATPRRMCYMHKTTPRYNVVRYMSNFHADADASNRRMPRPDVFSSRDLPTVRTVVTSHSVCTHEEKFEEMK